MKRLICALLCCMVLTCSLSAALAAKKPPKKDSELTEEEESEVMELEGEDDSIYTTVGKKYEEKNKEDFDVNSPALYRGTLGRDYSIFAERDTDSKRLWKPKGDAQVDILYVGLQWFITRHDKYIGYSKRQWIPKSTIETLDPVHTPPVNVQKHQYLATTATTCYVRKTMDPVKPGEEDDGNNWVVLKPGTKLTIWQFYEGWAMVNYMRSYGYIDPNQLTDLIPVSPTDEELYEDCPIAAYTSYYKMVQSDINKSRIHNIKVGCGYVSRVVQPGQEFDANKIMGPYRASKGYQKAPVLVDGDAVPGYGGGTCQVSSTLYNVLVQLPGIDITMRRPHGGEGASYLPIHCDAAVGNDNLNLKFVNRYDFPIRIVGQSNDDGALLMLIYRDHGEA